MVYSKFDPGCGCCGFGCATVIYPSQFPIEQWDIFTINEGSTRPPSEAFPQLLTTGQRLRPPTNGIQFSAEAWYHRIRFEGDIDLEYDGIAVQVRPEQGFIVSNGTTIPIMPRIPNDTFPTFWTDIALVVTPDWLAVMYYPLHRLKSFTLGPMFGGGIATSRGCIQVIDRVNDSRNRTVTLTAASDDVSVTSWTVSDMSVQIRNDQITQQCPQLQPPDGTEQLFVTQRSGTTTFTDPTFPIPASNSSTIPNTFSSSGDPLLVFAAALFGYTDWEWDDIFAVFATPEVPSELGLSPHIGPLQVGMIGNQSLRTVSGDFSSGVGSIVGWYHRVVWRKPTVANPYPKPESLTVLGLQDRATFAEQDRDTKITTYNAEGKAPATMTANALSQISWKAY